MTEVILVNKNDEPVGIIEKMAAHQQGLLHRAVSVFIVNKKNEMLLQQRALHKYHSGGLWSNACCSHPMPDETVMAAAERRLYEEMGFNTPLKKIFEFTYCVFFENGLTENEYDHVFMGIYEGRIQPDENEVMDYGYIPVAEIKHALLIHPERYTEWFKIAFPKIEEYLLR